MSYRTTVLVPPALEPVDLATAKQHLRVFYTEDDDLISAIISAAREWCEKEVSLSFITRQYRLSADTWEDIIREHYRPIPIYMTGSVWMPYPPLQSVQSVEYINVDGSYQTWDTDDYTVSAGTPGRITPVWGNTFPIQQIVQADAIRISYTAGYSDDPADVPKSAVQAMLLIIGQLYEQRSENTNVSINEVPFAAKALLSSLDPGIYA